jgi:hypothetical protein
MGALFQLIWHLFFLIAGSFFLLFGINLLICAYRLEDPFYFIMTFFSSSLIILISLTIIIGLGIRIYQAIRSGKKDQ